ncbi:sigma-w pathway protein ysdB [Falsibacillus albus]|uniref:Sigma-w pathway protein ysdB n=1 Tax=Falsibacillus albus TaxID=2478915 RepID=A0A3L7K571_9BACI|nr:sigma-w pathway protein ysdB [Falsibacillus albus]RLQ97990.1 sigma-w pathway protein ysdB [Falsibacillus albus]
MLWLFRFAIFALILYLLYKAIKFIIDPKRKLELAHEKKEYYFFDDLNNVRKNFLITYKGVMFEGEKYLGTTENAFDVVSIFVWPRNASKLQGLTYDDFMFLEDEISGAYENAKIDWKSPIKEFLEKKHTE